MAAQVDSAAHAGTGMELVSVQQYESGPPISYLNRLADDADTIAVEKSEEFIKKRRVEQTTTKQVETRVKRQVLVDQDGQVVEDSGPQVTTNTTREDTETKEENHTEHKGGDDGKQLAVPEGWVAVPGAIIVREKHHKKYNTRDEIDERLETEEVHHLGDVTNQELEAAISSPSGLAALTWKRQSSESLHDVDGQQTTSLVAKDSHQVAKPSSKRIVHQSRKHKRFIDQEDTQVRDTTSEDPPDQPKKALRTAADSLNQNNSVQPLADATTLLITADLFRTVAPEASNAFQSRVNRPRVDIGPFLVTKSAPMAARAVRL